MSGDLPLTRRRFVTATAAASIGALAGCSSSDDDPADTDTPGTSDDDPTDTDTADTPDDDPTDDGSTETDAPGADQSVSFRLVEDGDEVVGPVQLDVASEGIDLDGGDTFVVGVDADPVPEGEEISYNSGYIFFAAGKSHSVLELEEGEHTLTLQASDGDRVAYAARDTVDITVTETAGISVTAPEQGAQLTAPVTVEVETDGIALEAAGEIAQGAGHLHAIVNDESTVRNGVSFGDRAVHADDGSAEITLDEDVLNTEGIGDNDVIVQVGNGKHEGLPISDDVGFSLDG